MQGVGETWDFYIAEKLHKTVEEINQMPNTEYEKWLEYLNVKAVLRDLHQRTEANRDKG
jgi:hypothetical protein